jgi:hypothetical protein
MSRADKLVKRFLSKPKDFTFDELRQLLSSFGYEEEKAGKTAGSRVSFYNDQTDDEIKLHRPHPSPVMKRYLLDLVEQRLREKEGLK